MIHVNISRTNSDVHKKNITEESKKWATLSYVGFHVQGGVIVLRIVL